MSALEQIRQRPILIISILGLALLLFILTAVDRPGELFSDNHTVAEVGGQKIDYMEFQRRVEQQSEQMRNQGYTNIDNARIQSMVLQQMINEVLLKKEFDALGLVVTDNELSKAMLGETPHPMVARMVQQWGFPSADVLYDYAYNPQKYGLDPAQSQQLQQAWQALEKDTEQMILSEKFGNLFTGALPANKLDAQAYYNNNAATSTIAYVRKDFSTLADDEFKPTDADIEAIYNEEKNRFRINEHQYVIDYITVDIAPSKADLDVAAADVSKALAELRTSEGTDALAGNSKFYVNRVSAPKSKLAPMLSRSIDKLTADTVAQISFFDNRYTIAKLLSVTEDTDSVLLDMAIFAENAVADSVLNTLNAGTRPADLGEDLIARSQDSVWVSLVDPQIALIKDDILAAQAGTYFMSKNNPGVAMKVRSRKAPVAIYDIAEITYDVIPSSATVNQLNSDFRKFLEANNTPEKFASEAAKAGYNVLEAVVTPSTLAVNNLPESRNAAKWTIDHKKGNVSGVFTDDTDSRLMAVAIKDIFKGDFIPSSYANVRTYLEEKARNRMKGEKLVADFKGKANDMTGFAGLMKATVDTTQVTFGQPMVRNFPPFESALNANVAVAKQGQLVGPVALNNSVVVFQVINIDNQGRPFSFENDAMAFTRNEGAAALQNSMAGILLGNKKVKNRIQKFYADRQ
ncbi:MAG: SurA N-terminal domain-containing protein [Muribaculaceae bacterium]|nr:SurA N-terminal domain-containing protein [Muribaculaceae bacterium]